MRKTTHIFKCPSLNFKATSIIYCVRVHFAQRCRASGQLPVHRGHNSRISLPLLFSRDCGSDRIKHLPRHSHMRIVQWVHVLRMRIRTSIWHICVSTAFKSRHSNCSIIVKFTITRIPRSGTTAVSWRFNFYASVNIISEFAARACCAATWVTWTMYATWGRCLRIRDGAVRWVGWVRWRVVAWQVIRRRNVVVVIICGSVVIDVVTACCRAAVRWIVWLHARASGRSETAWPRRGWRRHSVALVTGWVLFWLVMANHMTVAWQSIRQILIEFMVIECIQRHDFRYTKVLKVDTTKVDRLGLWVTCKW